LPGYGLGWREKAKQDVQGQFDRSVILLCMRWYLAYNLSLRDLEEMMAERGIAVDHATIHLYGRLSRCKQNWL
jgi:transposase-like protein